MSTKTHWALMVSMAVALTVSGPAGRVAADHVTVNPQPGFDATQGDRLAHTDSRDIRMISTQLRIGTAWLRLGLQRVSAGQLESGPKGWLEPSLVGYHIISAASHGIDIRRNRSRAEDPMLEWEAKTISAARAYFRKGVEKSRMEEPGSVEYVVEQLNQGLALVQRLQLMYP